MRRVVAVAGDAGGAAALAPVLRALASMPEIDLRLFAYRQAVAMWSNLGLEIVALPDYKSVGADAWPGDARVHLVITGTSVNGINHERAALRWAAAAGVPSLSVVDFWSNYSARFHDDAVQASDLPSLIAVMDERARDDMASEGFPIDRLVVTGQPAFDDLAGFRSRWTSAMREAARNALLADAPVGDASLILFASQPLVEMGSLTGDSAPIDERAVLRAVVASLDQVAQRTGTDIVLVVRPHPREHLEPGDVPVGCRVHVKLSRAERPWGAALASDVVVGMTSVLLLEAALLGCAVVSIQPDGRIADPLPHAPAWEIARVYDLTKLTATLERALAASRTRAPDDGAGAAAGTATDRVVELTFRLLAKHGDRNE